MAWVIEVPVLLDLDPEFISHISIWKCCMVMYVSNPQTGSGEKGAVLMDVLLVFTGQLI